MKCIGCSYEFDPEDEIQSRYHESACGDVDLEWQEAVAARLRVPKTVESEGNEIEVHVRFPAPVSSGDSKVLGQQIGEEVLKAIDEGLAEAESRGFNQMGRDHEAMEKLRKMNPEGFKWTLWGESMRDRVSSLSTTSDGAFEDPADAILGKRDD